ncbi:hypothetical protein CANINC_002116 [Pichia inconspicua]|uniref:Uncharacterized protein n=1 Tax=Pichia inconspicua TaxID=52247 RepID=A0A4T0X210_9ASCO|nr:hypothetical protein CANINC_002116 [[Candida] inconspicua]
MSVIEPTGSLSSEEVIKDSVDAAESKESEQLQDTSPYTTKIKMLWKTGPPEGTRPVDGQDKILSGVFVFELDSENEKIVVFTIDNVELLNGKEEAYQGPMLGVSA